MHNLEYLIDSICGLRYKDCFFYFPLMMDTRVNKCSCNSKPIYFNYTHVTHEAHLSMTPPESPDRPLLGARESNSSKKITQGEALRAFWKTSRTFSSDWPTYMLISSGPLTLKSNRINGDFEKINHTFMSEQGANFADKMGSFSDRIASLISLYDYGAELIASLISLYGADRLTWKSWVSIPLLPLLLEEFFLYQAAHKATHLQLKIRCGNNTIER